MSGRISYAPAPGTPTRSPGRALRTPSRPVAQDLPSTSLPTTIFASDASLKSALQADMSAMDFTLRALVNAKIERKRAFEAELADILEEGKRVESERDQLETLTAEMQKMLQKEKEQAESGQAVVKGLEQRKRGMAEQIDSLKSDIEEWQAKLDRKQSGRNDMKEQIAAQASQNKPELSFFESVLGMTMQGKGRDLITFTFTQVDATSYTRPFTFDLDLSSSEYAVPLCAPSLPSTVLIQLVQSLNETRDFSTFLKNMRRAFVENLGVNAQNARKSVMGQ